MTERTTYAETIESGTSSVFTNAFCEYINVLNLPYFNLVKLLNRSRTFELLVVSDFI